MNTKVIYRILLGLAAIVLVVLLVDSVVTPINFEKAREQRETVVIKNLIALRTAEAEFRTEKGYFTADLDSLILFLKTTPKKEVYKVGNLSDQQLEAGLTELKAAKILEQARLKARAKQGIMDLEAQYEYVWKNDREVLDNHLQGFRRDTILTNMLESLYKGEYTEENIEDILYIPYTDQQRFEVEVNNNYTTSQGIRVPLIEVRAPYTTYLSDLDKQELVNLIDKENTLEHYTGLKFGDITAPNNNAGNWE